MGLEVGREGGRGGEVRNNREEMEGDELAKQEGGEEGKERR